MTDKLSKEEDFYLAKIYGESVIEVEEGKTKTFEVKSLDEVFDLLDEK